MRKFSLILSVFFLLSLCGCMSDLKTPISNHGSDPVYFAEPEISVTEIPVEDPKSDAPLPAYIINTKYYSITLPHDWADSCTFEIFKMENGLEILTLYEVSSRQEFGGGRLCSIQLMPTKDDTYKDFPSYELLGVLDTPDGSFHLIALFPTDVQFSEATKEAYNEMFAQIRDVLCTLSPEDGLELIMPAPVT